MSVKWFCKCSKLMLTDWPDWLFYPGGGVGEFLVHIFIPIPLSPSNLGKEEVCKMRHFLNLCLFFLFSWKIKTSRGSENMKHVSDLFIFFVINLVCQQTFQKLFQHLWQARENKITFFDLVSIGFDAPPKKHWHWKMVWLGS